jgi:hypothetical protein
MILALSTTGRFAGRLDRGQKQRNEHADDGDDDQQLNQRKRATRSVHGRPLLRLTRRTISGRQFVVGKLLV